MSIVRLSSTGFARGVSAIALVAWLAVAVCLAVTPTLAGTTWDGGGSDTNFTTSANWNGDSTPPFAANDVLTFATGTSRLATINSSITVGQFIYNSPQPFVIGSSNSSTLTLQGVSNGGVNTGITASLPWTVGSGTYTLSTPVILGADQSWNVSNGSGTTTLLVSGPISGSGRSLTKLGNGVLALSGSNTYTGATAVSAGTLELRTGGSLAGPVAIATAGTLRFGNGAATTLPFANAISGAGNVAVTGGGAVQFTGANTYTGSTLITGGELAVSSAAALGGGTSPIVVTGADRPAGAASGGLLPADFGYVGGQLAIVSGDGVTLSRNLQLSGNGLRTLRSGAVPRFFTLRSTGNNVLSGSINASAGSLQSNFGTLRLTGAVSSTTTGTSTFIGGSGGVVASGPVSMTSGTLSIYGGNVRLTNSSNSIGNIEVLGTDTTWNIITGNSGSLEVASAAALGNARVTLADGDGNRAVGLIRFRTADAAGFGAANTTVVLRANSNATTANVFVDNARGGSDLNQTLPLRLGDQRTSTNTDYATFVFLGGHGYNVSLTGTGGGTISLVNTRGVTFANSSNGLLTLAADASTPLTGGAFYSLTSLGDMAVNGSLLATDGTGRIFEKKQSGRVVMSGTLSNLTGTNSLNDGTLQVRGLGSLASGTINIGSGATAATLEYIGPTSGAGETWSRAINLSGTTGGGYLYASQSGASPGALVINGPITASGSGAKTFVLGGSSTQDNAIATSIPTSGSSTVMSLQKIGVGTWVLSGTNAYTGSTTVAGGVLKVQAGAGNIVQDTSGIVFNVDAFTNSAAGTLAYVGANTAASTETVGSLTPTAGAGRITATGSGAGGSANLTFASLGSRSPGATIDFATASGGTIAFTSAPAGSNGILGGWATFGGLDWAASGSPAAAYTGYTTLDASSNSGTANFRLTTGSVGLSGTASVNSLKLVGTSGTTAVGLGGTLTNTSGGVLFDNSAGSAQITGSQLGAAGSELVVHTAGSGAAADLLTIGSLIGSGTTALTKSGGGTLVLTAANTYTGNTTINEGTLRLSGASATLGTISVAGNRTTIRQAGTLDLNAAGTNATVTIGMLNGSGTVTNSGGGASTAGTLSIGNSTTTTGTGYFTGIVQDGAGRLAVTKTGNTASVQYLTGANTYTGPTTIVSGTLGVTTLANIGSDSGIGRGDATNADTNAASLVFNGGVLLYTGNNGVVWQPTQTPSVSIDRLFTLAGAGTIESTGMYGDNDFSNANSTNTRNAATLILSNTGAVRFSGAGGSRALTLSGNAPGINSVGSVLDNQIAMLLADSGSYTLAVNKAGTTLWKLTNTGNAYTGATTVSNGLLEVGDDSSASTRTLSPNSNLNLSGGFLVSSGTFARGAGTGPGQVQLSGGAASGFAAGADDLVVNLGSGTLAWGSGNFNVGTLNLNGPTSQGTVTFASPIDLGNTTRTIWVGDNLYSSFDYAIVSGVISGSGGLTKTGPTAASSSPYGGGVAGAPLRLSAANTYSGTTTISVGSLVVETIGGTNSIASNLGSGSASVLLSGTSSLDYIGTGETSTRQIRVTVATTGAAINNNGSGPLVLTNLGVSGTGGTTTITLGGAYPGANEVRSNLAVSGGTLNITLPTTATWTLSGSNTLGTVTLGAGAVLGLGSDTAVNASATLVPSVYHPSSFAAVGGDRQLAANIPLTSNGNTFGFTGDYSITLTGTVNSTQIDRTMLLNSITSGTLFVNGPIVTAAGHGLNLGGSGRTVLNGAFTTAGIVKYNGDATGSLTFSGSYAGNSITSVSAVNVGPMIFSSSNAIPGTGAIMTGNAGSTLAAGYAVDQAFLGRITSTGSSLAVALAADSSNNLDFSSAGRNLTAASLGAVGPDTRIYSGTLTPNGTAYRLGGGGGTLDFQGPLTGTSNTLTIGGDLTGLGGTVILSSATNSYGGATTVQRGILQIASLANAGSNSSTGTNASITLSSGTSVGTLRYVGSGHASNRTISIASTAGGIIDASGSGALDLTSGTISVTSNATVTLTGSSTADNSVGAIAGTTGVNVTKTGPGLWRLTAASGFLGRLTVTSGTIVATTGVEQNGSGVFGGGTNDNQQPLVGDATPGAMGQAAVLLTSGVLIDRGLDIAGPIGATQEVILGMASSSGTATFGGGGSIRLGRDVTLQAADGGTARFLNGWKEAGGGANPNVTFNVGSAGNAGTVIFGSFVPDSIDAVNVRRGTLRLDYEDQFGATLGYATPVTLGETGTGGTLNINGITQQLGSLSFTGVGSTAIGSGTLRLFNSGSGARANVTGMAHQISAAMTLADNSTFTTGSAARLLVSSAISGSSSYSFTKAGPGILELSGTSSYTGATFITDGQMRVNGQLGNTPVTVQAGATLGGSGRLAGNLTGDGLIAPGNSPGILTVDGQITPTGTTSFAFELTSTGTPTWSNASASVNDVLRLTNADPFTSGLTSGNIVNVYFDVATLAVGNAFLGGFFADNGTYALETDLANATYAYFVRGNGGGLNPYNGTSYYTLAQYMAANPGITGVTRSVVPVASADFAGGTITTGQATQFVIIPEPGALALAGIGIAAAAWAARRRHRRADCPSAPTSLDTRRPL